MNRKKRMRKPKMMERPWPREYRTWTEYELAEKEWLDRISQWVAHREQVENDEQPED